VTPSVYTPSVLEYYLIFYYIAFSFNHQNMTMMKLLDLLKQENNTFPLPAGAWPKGAYLYRVETATEKVSGKVIKN